MKKIITEHIIEQYCSHLRNEEKSVLTIKKYIRDVRKLMKYWKEYGGCCDMPPIETGASTEKVDIDDLKYPEITKEIVISFKDNLYNEKHYKVESVNSILSSINRFFDYMEWYELKVKSYKIQRESFTSEERYMNKEEYRRLLGEARKRGNKRLYLIMETLASTGMRVSEVCYVTVASLKTGIVEVNNKGKIRKVMLTKKMRIQLMKYAGEQGIDEGIVFCTKSGRAVDRTNVWKEMKALCDDAGVEKSKVFPHSLRKLFARSLYKIQHDLAKVADILGHSNIETTRRYVRETSIEHQKLLERLQLVGGYW